MLVILCLQGSRLAPPEGYSALEAASFSCKHCRVRPPKLPASLCAGLGDPPLGRLEHDLLCIDEILVDGDPAFNLFRHLACLRFPRQATIWIYTLAGCDARPWCSRFGHLKRMARRRPEHARSPRSGLAVAKRLPSTSPILLVLPEEGRLLRQVALLCGCQQLGVDAVPMNRVIDVLRQEVL